MVTSQSKKSVLGIIAYDSHIIKKYFYNVGATINTVSCNFDNLVE